MLSRTRSTSRRAAPGRPTLSARELPLVAALSAPRQLQPFPSVLDRDTPTIATRLERAQRAIVLAQCACVALGDDDASPDVDLRAVTAALRRLLEDIEHDVYFASCVPACITGFPAPDDDQWAPKVLPEDVEARRYAICDIYVQAIAEARRATSGAQAGER